MSAQNQYTRQQATGSVGAAVIPRVRRTANGNDMDDLYTEEGDGDRGQAPPILSDINVLLGLSGDSRQTQDTRFSEKATLLNSIQSIRSVARSANSTFHNRASDHCQSRSPSYCVFVFAGGCSTTLVDNICSEHWARPMNTTLMAVAPSYYMNTNTNDVVTSAANMDPIALYMTESHRQIFPMVGVLARLGDVYGWTEEEMYDRYKNFYTNRLGDRQLEEKLGVGLYHMVYGADRFPCATHAASVVAEIRHAFIEHVSAILRSKYHTNNIGKWASYHAGQNTSVSMCLMLDEHVSIFEMPLWLLYVKGLYDTASSPGASTVASIVPTIRTDATDSGATVSFACYTMLGPIRCAPMLDYPRYKTEGITRMYTPGRILVITGMINAGDPYNTICQQNVNTAQFIVKAIKMHGTHNKTRHQILS